MVDGGSIGLEWMGWDGMCIDKVRYWYQDVCITQCRNNKRADGCLLGERPVGALVLLFFNGIDFLTQLICAVCRSWEICRHTPQNVHYARCNCNDMCVSKYQSSFTDFSLSIQSSSQHTNSFTCSENNDFLILPL
jgi:hypothetical protein